MFRTILAAFAAVCAWIPAPAHAQTAAPRGGVNQLLRPEQPASSFSLEWVDLLWGSERVTVDGRPLVYGRDYSLDYHAGALFLAHPAPAGSVLCVSYRLRPFVSRPSGAGVPALEHVPIPGTRRRLARDLAARLSGARGPAAPTLSDGPTFGSAEAASPEEKDHLKNELLSGLRETRVDDQIASGKGDLAPGSAHVSYFRADPLLPATMPDAREEFSTQLDLRPRTGSRLSFSNELTRGSLFSGVYEETERQRLRFEQTWDKSTATLMWDRQRSDGYGVANALDALSLAVTHPFTRTLGAEGFFAYQDSLYRGREAEGLVSLRELLGRTLEFQAGAQLRTSDYAGNTVDTGATLYARPVNGTEAAFAFRQSDSETYGRSQKVSANLDAALGSSVQLTGEISRRTADKLGNIDTFGLGLAARPTSETLLEAAFSESVGESIGRERTSTVRLGLDPTSGLKVQLGYDLLQSSLRGETANALWIVSVGGRRYVRVEGYTGRHAVGDASFNDSLYRVEVRPVPAFAVSGSLRQVANDAEQHAVAGVGASLKVLNTLDVSAEYRRPTIPVAGYPGLYGGDVRLSLAPVRGFRVFGEYSLRPEDETGSLLDQTHRSVGLETSLGSLSLQGSVTDVQGFAPVDPGQRLDFLASLNVTRSTRLYGGLSLLSQQAADSPQNRIYRLGISQNAGSSLFLLLEGQVGWLVDAAGAQTLNPDDARAQARIGVRF